VFSNLACKIKDVGREHTAAIRAAAVRRTSLCSERACRRRQVVVSPFTNLRLARRNHRNGSKGSSVKIKRFCRILRLPARYGRSGGGVSICAINDEAGRHVDDRGTVCGRCHGGEPQSCGTRILLGVDTIDFCLARRAIQ